MTPERIAELEQKLERLRPYAGAHKTSALGEAWLALEEVVVFAKSAIPSGQVAEDEVRLRECVTVKAGHDPRTQPLFDTLSRLAAQAQSAETYRANWQEAERGRVALLAELDASRGERNVVHTQAARESETFRAALIAETDSRRTAEARVAELEADAARAVATLGGQPGEALQHCAERVRYEWEQTAERYARLSAAGQVPSEHVDKTAGGPVGHVHGCPCAECVRAYPDAENARQATREYVARACPPKGAGAFDVAELADIYLAATQMDAVSHSGLEAVVRHVLGETAEPYKTTVGHKITGPELLWTMRDEFAKAAMHAVILACKTELDAGTLKYAVVARRARDLADAMMKEMEAT